MAKQTFTSGNVLTAAQMTSLQQTAMGGGEATAKTASYVLVAADAGTTVIMNSASATTITVNTSLFAAGDTVNIQNIGAGVCTITNGTATVSTAGSLALSQWEGGVLYFRSASTATFFDYVQTGTTIPLTTKGDLLGYDTAINRIPIGTNNQVLTADSAQALGLKWATPSSGSMTLLSTTTISTMVTEVTGISGSYQHLMIKCSGINVGSNSPVYIYWGNTGSYGGSYQAYQIELRSATTPVTYSNSTATSGLDVCGGNTMDGATSNNAMFVYIPYYTLTMPRKPVQVVSSLSISGGIRVINAQCTDYSGGSGAISKFKINFQTGSSWTGTIEVYGVN